MPVHGQGSAMWKELEAMKDVVLKSQSNGYILRQPLTAGGPIPTEPPRKNIKFQVMTALKRPIPGPHEHELILTADQIDFIKDGGTQTVTTTTAASHEHTVSVKAYKDSKKQKWVFYIKKCDAKDFRWKMCWDEHPNRLVQMPDQ
ncbi:uncharacterized protein LOC116306319 [Actinia tenebrosa]|uniref:Uncharacterized protein LOC116306319 n=1 Tax=Actinia tenebrosa TaxID=6105 RepID=A0A6P8J286_ACTTE|nr:uncharacterized protein LOC116306319 [Actinia tenebrosa]